MNAHNHGAIHLDRMFLGFEELPVAREGHGGSERAKSLLDSSKISAT